MNKLDEFLAVAKRHGMTYAELQVLESLGYIRVINGRLYKTKKAKIKEG